MRQLSGTEVPDATSGFRAYSRDAALQLNVVSDFTYTIETIISAGEKKSGYCACPGKNQYKLRESRLFPSIRVYLQRSLVTMLKVYSMYRPLRLFTLAGGTTFLLGFAIGCRYLFFFFMGQTEGHIQSLDFIRHPPYCWLSNYHDGNSRRTYLS